jgi:hypothetical protein
VDFWNVAKEYGLPIAFLWFGVMALYFDWVVSGKRYREAVRQRDRLLKLALGGQRKAWQATELAEAVVPTVGGEDGDDVRPD